MARMARMVESWNGGMAEWRNGRMVEWRNGGMAEWQNGGMAEWRDGGNGGNGAMAGMVKWWEWQNGRMAKKGMEGGWNGQMEEGIALKIDN